MIRLIGTFVALALLLVGAATAQTAGTVFVDGVAISATKSLPIAPVVPGTITASSGNVAAAVGTATLAAAVGKTTYICGFTITSTGATAASVVSPTVTGGISGTMTFTYASVAGAAVSNQPVVIKFNPCLPASAQNTAIAAALPSLGAGNTNATVNAWGFQY